MYRNLLQMFWCSAQRKVSDNLLLFTPGVNISSVGDTKGQQYNTPERVFKMYHTDFMIVGRGIYKAANSKEALWNIKSWLESL